MPGNNSKFDSTNLGVFDRYFTTKVHVILIFKIFLIEIVGMIRFYYIFPHMRFGLESIVLTLFLLFADFMIIKGIYRTKGSDPGYMIPLPASKPNSNDDI